MTLKLHIEADESTPQTFESVAALQASQREAEWVRRQSIRLLQDDVQVIEPEQPRAVQPVRQCESIQHESGLSLIVDATVDADGNLVPVDRTHPDYISARNAQWYRRLDIERMRFANGDLIRRWEADVAEAEYIEQYDAKQRREMGLGKPVDLGASFERCQFTGKIL